MTQKVLRSFRSPELRRATELALAAGWTARITGSGHVALRSPTGQTVVMSQSSTRAGRSIKNALSDLRRAGLEL